MLTAWQIRGRVVPHEVLAGNALTAPFASLTRQQLFLSIQFSAYGRMKEFCIDDPEIAEIVQFPDPETAKILQLLDPDIANMDQEISGSRNCRNGAVSGSRNHKNAAFSGFRN